MRSIFPSTLVVAVIAGVVGMVMAMSSADGSIDKSIGIFLVALSGLAAQYAIAGLAARQALREHAAAAVSLDDETNATS